MLLVLHSGEQTAVYYLVITYNSVFSYIITLLNTNVFFLKRIVT